MYVCMESAVLKIVDLSVKGPAKAACKHTVDKYELCGCVRLSMLENSS